MCPLCFWVLPDNFYCWLFGEEKGCMLIVSSIHWVKCFLSDDLIRAVLVGILAVS